MITENRKTYLAYLRDPENERKHVQYGLLYNTKWYNENGVLEDLPEPKFCALGAAIPALGLNVDMENAYNNYTACDAALDIDIRMANEINGWNDAKVPWPEIARRIEAQHWKSAGIVYPEDACV